MSLAKPIVNKSFKNHNAALHKPIIKSMLAYGQCKILKANPNITKTAPNANIKLVIVSTTESFEFCACSGLM